MTIRLGVDIGGTGIKAAPAAVAVIVAELVDNVGTDGLVGPSAWGPAGRREERAHR